MNWINKIITQIKESDKLQTIWDRVQPTPKNKLVISIIGIGAISSWLIYQSRKYVANKSYQKLLDTLHNQENQYEGLVTTDQNKLDSYLSKIPYYQNVIIEIVLKEPQEIIRVINGTNYQLFNKIPISFAKDYYYLPNISFGYDKIKPSTRFDENGNQTNAIYFLYDGLINDRTFLGNIEETEHALRDYQISIRDSISLSGSSAFSTRITKFDEGTTIYLIGTRNEENDCFEYMCITNNLERLKETITTPNLDNLYQFSYYSTLLLASSKISKSFLEMI